MNPPDPTIHTDEQMFAQAATGNHAAFTRLFHYYNARLFGFVNKVTRSEAISEEIVQEVFMRVWVNKEKLATYEQPGAWIFRIATNLALNYQRDTARLALRKQDLFLTQSTNTTHTDHLDNKELLSLLEEAINHLPPKRQQIFRMSRQDGMSYQQIADHLSISTNTVKDHLLFAMRFIRERIKQQSGISVSVLLLFQHMP